MGPRATSCSIGPRRICRGVRTLDSHGSDDPGHWNGGIAGDIFDIGWNTFLTTSRPNFMQRGTPCHYSYFHDNVSRVSSRRPAAIR